MKQFLNIEAIQLVVLIQRYGKLLTLKHALSIRNIWLAMKPKSFAKNSIKWKKKDGKQNEVDNMSRRTKSWILLTNDHVTETHIAPEGDHWPYIIAPNSDIKKDDIVYLWWNPQSYFFGWGEVAETPMLTMIETPGQHNEIEKRRRTSVFVHRKKRFSRLITEQTMTRDKHLKHFIPTGFDDLYAVPLRPGQAHYLNDFIREHNLDAPAGSTTIKWIAEVSAPQITVQAILTFGDKTSEGKLVEAVRITWDEIVRLFAHNPEEIYTIDPRKFEELIAGAYVREGYKVELTPLSNDKGRDVIARKDGINSIRIFDQVKRYKISRPVTAEEVRALVGVLTLDPNVSKGVITTTSTFAPTLLDDDNIRRLVPYRLELKPRDVLLPWLEKLRLR